MQKIQSSPPARALEQPGSPVESMYSLDLEALHLNDDTDTSIDIPRPKVEQIRSEDIDGPSDFTQNMDAWMRGGTFPRSAAPVPAAGCQHPNQTETQVDPNEQSSTENEPGRTSVVPQHLPDDEFSSVWEPADGIASTPAILANKRLLQPFVEDYHSSVNGSRITSARGPSFDRTKLATTARPKHGKTDDRAPSRQSDASDDESVGSPSRRPIIASQPMIVDNVDESANTNHLLHIEKLQARCRELEILTESLKQAVVKERGLREQQTAEYNRQINEVASREIALLAQHDEAIQHDEELQAELNETRQRVQNQEAGSIASDSTLRASTGGENDVERLKGQLQRQAIEHQERIDKSQQEVQKLRKTNETIASDARLYAEALKQQDDLHQAEIKRLQLEVDHTHDQDFALAELERRVDKADADNGRLKAARAETEDDLATARTQLVQLKEDHRQDMTRVTNERSRAVDLATTLQRQLQEARAQLRDHQASHEADLNKAHAEHREASTTSTREVEVLRQEHEAQQSELNAAIIERDEAQDTISTLEQQVKDLNGKLAEMKAVNANLDAQVRGTMEKRDQRWKDKLEAANRERQLLSKALMHQWGREEVGLESPQRYVYRMTT